MKFKLTHYHIAPFVTRFERWTLTESFMRPTTVSRYSAVVIAALTVATGVAQGPQPTISVGRGALPMQPGVRGGVDRADLGDFYYFDGQPVRLDRSLTDTVVRVRPGRDNDVAALARTLSPQASLQPPAGHGPREYWVVKMPSGTRAPATQSWADFLRGQDSIEFAAPALISPTTGRGLLLTEEILVKLGPGVAIGALTDLATAQGLRVVRVLPFVADEYVLELTHPKSGDPLAMSRTLYESGLLAWAEPNFIQEMQPLATPNDPRFGQQWHLSNTGALGGTAGADVKAPAAWDIETGTSSTVIAVIDDGVETTHPDLAPNMFRNPGEVAGNGIDDDGNGFVDDVSGWDFVSNDNDPNPGAGDNHGTAVAGLAAAKGGNGIGVSGACQNCRILPVRIVLGGSDAIFATAIRYAATFADVINNSWGIASPSAAIQSAIAFANTHGRGGKGSLSMFATGNSASHFEVWLVSGIPAGTHRFRITYAKDSTGSAGADTAWLAWSLFPGVPLDTFQSGGLPAGWATGGNAGWTVVTDPTHADEGMCLTRAARAGAIGHGQSTYLEATRTVTAGSWANYLWVSSEAQRDGVSMQIDIGNNGTFDINTGLLVSGARFINQSVGYPAAHPEAIAVGASSDRDCRTHYSQFGSELAFIAPSSSGSPLNAAIETTDRTGGSGYDGGDYTQAAGLGFGGTSASTPIAAGIAGLIISRNPTLTRAEVLQILQNSADEVGPEPYVGHRNDRYGYGRLNAYAALLATPPPGAPTANHDSHGTPHNTTLNVVAPGVLGNDDANSGGSMTAVLESATASGALTLNADGSFAFVPANGSSGPVTFTYRASNTGGVSSPATVTITVAPAPPSPPTAVNDSYNTPLMPSWKDFAPRFGIVYTALIVGAPGVLGNDDSNGGGTMTTQLMSSTDNGTLSLGSNGGFTYTPNDGFAGVDSFTYRAVNGVGPGNTVTVSIAVTPLAPTTVAEAYSTASNTALNVPAPGVLSNDNSNGGGAMTALRVTPAANGVVSLNANGSFNYTPDTGFSGGDSFTYRAVNGVGPGNIVTVTVTTTPPLPPTSAADTYRASHNAVQQEEESSRAPVGAGRITAVPSTTPRGRFRR